MKRYHFFPLVCVLLLSACSQTVKREGITMDMTYTYTITRDPQTDWDVVHLIADNLKHPEKSLSIKIVPMAGNNMVSMKVGDIELIEAPTNLNELLNQCWGNPLLFPTPNRIRNSTYEFMGKTYTMSFPGEKQSHMCHGLVWDDTAWKYSDPEISGGAIHLKTWYIFDESNPRFPAYPFVNTLTVEYTLMKDRVKISYEVENRDTKPLGFGFALHPFWKVIGGKENTRIQVAVPYHMEATKDLLPTGKIEPVQGTKWSLMEPRPVSELKLDDVYLGATPETPIRVIYDTIGLEIHQKATADFTHVVVYTPNKEYFCIENQTCSTDAHNLYSRGLKEESHLQILQPGKKTGGSVEFSIVRK